MSAANCRHQYHIGSIVLGAGHRQVARPDRRGGWCVSCSAWWPFSSTSVSSRCSVNTQLANMSECLHAGPGETAFMKSAGSVAVLFVLSRALGENARLVCFCVMAATIMQVLVC